MGTGAGGNEQVQEVSTAASNQGLPLGRALYNKRTAGIVGILNKDIIYLDVWRSTPRRLPTAVAQAVSQPLSVKGRH
jgi:hypothetical protein